MMSEETICNVLPTHHHHADRKSVAESSNAMQDETSPTHVVCKVAIEIGFGFQIQKSQAIETGFWVSDTKSQQLNAYLTIAVGC